MAANLINPKRLQFGLTVAKELNSGKCDVFYSHYLLLCMLPINVLRLIRNTPRTPLPLDPEARQITGKLA